MKKKTIKKKIKFYSKKLKEVETKRPPIGFINYEKKKKELLK